MSTEVRPSKTEAQSNVSPELASLVRSEAFKQWFGDWENDPASASKLVDENGEPALVYFGGPAGITKLSGDQRNRTGSDELGHYFTRRRSNAKFYAETLRDIVTDEPRPSSIYAAFLNVRSPYERRAGDGIRTERVTSVPEGYDGYINESAAEIVVFNPDQVYLVSETPVYLTPVKVPLSTTISFEN